LPRSPHPSDIDPYTFHYRTKVQADAAAVPLIRLSISRSARVGIHVQFEPTALPERVWWFREQDFLATEREPSPKQLLPTDPFGFYSKPFFDVRNEIIGLGWR
jgi:hypothetical protein